MTRPAVALVDAYTSGKYLEPRLRARGADVVHVRSTSEWMPSMPRPDTGGYVAELVHRDLADTERRLRGFPLIGLLAGQEPGVELADALAARLGLPGNGAGLSPARRDKFLMIEALRAAGLRCADQTKDADPARLRAWAAARLPAGQVVVKPLRSAASDQVHFCRTVAEVDRAVAAVLGSATIYGEPNRDALVQTCLPGPEYVVDMVSVAGTRFLCGVWCYEKLLLPSGRNVYAAEYLVQDADPLVDELADYVGAALDALGVRHGPTHAEVIRTPQGPALVEVGTRLAGNMHPDVHDRCTGGNQAALTALGVLDPAGFVRRHGGRRYRSRAAAACCTTSTEQEGMVVEVRQDVVRRIRSLPTVVHLDLKLAPGDPVRPTIDLYSSTMRIFLCGAGRAELDADRARIDALKEDVFVVTPEADRATPAAATAPGAVA